MAFSGKGDGLTYGNRRVQVISGDGVSDYTTQIINALAELKKYNVTTGGINEGVELQLVGKGMFVTHTILVQSMNNLTIKSNKSPIKTRNPDASGFGMFSFSSCDNVTVDSLQLIPSPGDDRGILNGATISGGATITVTVSGNTATFTMASGTWAAMPKKNDTLYIPDGTLFATANEGFYTITRVSTTVIVATKIANVANMTITPPSAQGPLALALTTDMRCFAFNAVSAGSGVRLGTLFDNCSNVTVRNCRMTNIAVSGICFRTSQDVAAYDNYISDIVYNSTSTQAEGINWLGCANVNVYRNNVSLFERIGIVSDINGSTRSKNVNIWGNTVTSAKNMNKSASENNAGIWCECTDGSVTIRDNFISGMASNTGQSYSTALTGTNRNLIVAGTISGGATVAITACTYSSTRIAESTTGMVANFTIASGTWNTTPTVKDILYLPTGSVFDTECEGYYVVTFADSTNITASKLKDVSGTDRTFPKTMTATALVATTDIQAFSPAAPTTYPCQNKLIAGIVYAANGGAGTGAVQTNVSIRGNTISLGSSLTDIGSIDVGQAVGIYSVDSNLINTSVDISNNSIKWSREGIYLSNYWEASVSGNVIDCGTLTTSTPSIFGMNCFGQTSTSVFRIDGNQILNCHSGIRTAGSGDFYINKPVFLGTSIPNKTVGAISVGTHQSIKTTGGSGNMTANTSRIFIDSPLFSSVVANGSFPSASGSAPNDDFCELNFTAPIKEIHLSNFSGSLKMPTESSAATSTKIVVNHSTISYGTDKNVVCLSGHDIVCRDTNFVIRGAYTDKTVWNSNAGDTSVKFNNCSWNNGFAFNANTSYSHIHSFYNCLWTANTYLYIDVGANTTNKSTYTFDGCRFVDYVASGAIRIAAWPASNKRRIRVTNCEFLKSTDVTPIKIEGGGADPQNSILANNIKTSTNLTTIASPTSETNTIAGNY